MCAGVSRSAWLPWVLCEAVWAVLASQWWLSCLNRDSQGLTAVRYSCEPSNEVILFCVRSLLSQPWAECGCRVSQDRGGSWVCTESKHHSPCLSESQRGGGLRSPVLLIALVQRQGTMVHTYNGCSVLCPLSNPVHRWAVVTVRTRPRSCSAGWAGLSENRSVAGWPEAVRSHCRLALT